MSGTTTQYIPLPSDPLIDPKTGQVGIVWFTFFSGLYDRTGGSSPLVPGAPGGLNGNIQFNNTGAFGGLTNTQLTTRIGAFTATLKGAVPASGGGTANFLRADATFAQVNLTANVSGVLPVANGGTALASGTSGGVLGYTAAGVLASSGALANHAIVLGGGAGATPTALGSLGTTTTVLHGNAAGAPAFGAVSLTADVTGTLPVGNGGTGVAALPVSSQATPGNPVGTASTVGVMVGLAGAFPPAVRTKALIIVSGTIFNATAIADGGKVQIRFGTGAAPANGDALTGTAAGGLVQYVTATTAEKAPFSLNAIVTVTPATAIWIDVGLAAITGGTATISDVSISALEVS